jgi:hypothetical protein
MCKLDDRGWSVNHLGNRTCESNAVDLRKRWNSRVSGRCREWNSQVERPCPVNGQQSRMRVPCRELTAQVEHHRPAYYQRLGWSQWPKQPLCRSRWSEIAASILRCESFATRWRSTCEFNNLPGAHTILCHPFAGRVRSTCKLYSVNHPLTLQFHPFLGLIAIDLQVPFPERYI